MPIEKNSGVENQISCDHCKPRTVKQSGNAFVGSNKTSFESFFRVECY